MSDSGEFDVRSASDDPGIARRELIRRSVAAGSLVWAAPAITGISRAYAQQSPAPGGGGGGGDSGTTPPRACATLSRTTSPDSASAGLESGARFLLTERAQAECTGICSAGACPPGFRCVGRLPVPVGSFIGAQCTLNPPPNLGLVFTCTTPGVACECICLPA